LRDDLYPYISECDSRHKRFFVFDGQVCVLIF